VAAECHAEIDVRAERQADVRRLESKFAGLKAGDKRCSIEVTGGFRRPPMERTARTAKLFGIARELAAELDVDLQESMSGGGSDGNFTAALGVPTLDGLGAVGEGAHAANESVLIDRIADRTALLAKLVARL
jgi:glutamate carboxypeptidase